MKLKSYTKMKDSGVEWIGKIPEHWEVTKFRRICNLRQGLQISRNERFFEQGINRMPYITIRAIHAGDNFHAQEYIENASQRVICKSDDVLLARTGGTGEVITNKTGVFHNNFFLIDYDRNKIDRDFLVYYLKNSHIKKQILLLAGTTTIPDLNHGDFLDIPFILFPKNEQEKISNFLNNSIIEIDLELQKNKKLVKLLQEKRKVTINHFIINGIDPLVSMKDSGIDWIGKIPEHWNVRKFKTIGKLNSGGTPSTQVKEYWNNGTIPWLSSGEINNNIIESSNEKITELGLRESTARLFPKGSVLLAITGQGKTRGRTSLLKIDSSSNQSVVGIAIDHSKIFNYFLWYYLQSQYWNLRSLSQGSAQSGLNLHILKNYYIPSNSLIEQKEIVDYIDEHTLKINLVIKNIQSQIKKLQEFTQSLTSSAVTGKIDVRGIII